MRKENVSLNFLALDPTNFSVTLYVKLLEEISVEHRRNYYIRDLPSNDSKSRPKFAISFEPQDGLEQRVIINKENIDVTKKALLFFLRIHLVAAGVPLLDNHRTKYQRLIIPIENHTEGVETIWLEPYYLEDHSSFGFLIDYKFWVNDEYRKGINSPVSKRILQLSGTLDNRGYSNRAFYQFKYDRIKKFLATYYERIKTFTFSNFEIALSNTLSEVSTYSLEQKVYQFNEDLESPSPYNGLQKYPPFQLPEKRTKFLFVFKESDRSIAITLLNGLKGLTSPSTFPGIERLFKIPFNNDCIRGKKVLEINHDVLKEIIEEVDAERNSDSNLLPIIITNSTTTPSDEKLYFLIKHTFTSQNIPCQVVTKDLVINTKALTWSLSNIALQIFAKSGGKPWKVKPAIKEGLIVGIGSRNKEALVTADDGTVSRKIEKYLTYSVLTDSSGLFKEIQVLSEASSENDYYKSLVAKLKQVFLQAIQDGYKDIAVHIPFRISREKVWDVVFKDVPKNISISIILINSDHKFFGFDLSKNALVPYESTFVTISSHEYLVWFEGLQYNNAPFTKPIGSPVYVNLWYSNNLPLWKNLSYRRSLLQDCINLSGANWRGFRAKQLPVSVYYCQKIADFLKKFEEHHLDHVEFENLKPWFL